MKDRTKKFSYAASAGSRGLFEFVKKITGKEGESFLNHTKIEKLKKVKN